MQICVRFSCNLVCDRFIKYGLIYTIQLIWIHFCVILNFCIFRKCKGGQWRTEKLTKNVTGIHDYFIMNIIYILF